ncbi:MAG: nucleoside deaminase [Thermodesulfobacteriota bacterium]
MDHHDFMGLALDQARLALARGEFPVGAVIVADGLVVASGRRQNSRDSAANELDHAEIVALRVLLAERPDIDRGALVVYSTMEPCLMCYATLLLNGVRTMVYAYEDAMGGGTGLELGRLAPLYREMAPAVRLVPGVRRAESLTLFKDFFAGSGSDYWRGSLLEEYTLAQP